VLPFHRAVLEDEAFAPADAARPFSVHTRWIETEARLALPAYGGPVGEGAAAEQRQSVTVEVGGRRLEVVLPAALSPAPAPALSARRAAAPKRAGARRAGAAVTGDALTSPMQGTIVKVAVAEGQSVAAGDLIVVLEAMKMEQPLTAHKAGTVVSLGARIGATVTAGAVLCEIKD
jgi:acetyl-CoA/propionyl-CoA carboxylase biotin carboxyl carrier protein